MLDFIFFALAVCSLITSGTCVYYAWRLLHDVQIMLMQAKALRCEAELLIEQAKAHAAGDRH